MDWDGNSLMIRMDWDGLRWKQTDNYRECDGLGWKQSANMDVLGCIRMNWVGLEYH